MYEIGKTHQNPRESWEEKPIFSRKRVPRGVFFPDNRTIRDEKLRCPGASLWALPPAPVVGTQGSPGARGAEGNRGNGGAQADGRRGISAESGGRRGGRSTPRGRCC